MSPMDDNDELLRGLEAGVLADPDNVSLRLHLASMLIDLGRASDGLDHCLVVLRDNPNSDRAIELAARARLLMGEASEPARVAADGAATSATDLFEVFRPDVSLADVAGMEGVKDRLRTMFLEPLRNEELRRMYGASLGGGLLLYGPPGCGKTFLARALAGELGVYFVSIGITDVLDMWLGASERNIRDLFDSARELAPTVVFIDEIDALGHKRSRFRADSAARNVVNQLLAELDGIDSANDGVFVLAATNQPWDVDPALRRPGRLGRAVAVLPPDREARLVILGRLLADRPVGDIDLGAIADRTDLYSGADIQHLCDTATQSALSDSVRSGRPRPITQADLLGAVAEVRPSTMEWLRTARNYAEFANADGSLDDLLAYLDHHGIT